MTTPAREIRAIRGPRVIGRSGDRSKNLTTETRRHGEDSGERIIRSSEIASPVILSVAPRKALPHVADGRGVEVEAAQRASEPAAEILSEAKEPMDYRCSEILRAPSLRSGFRLRTPAALTSANRLNFDSPSSREAGLRLAQDDSARGNRLHKHSFPAPGAFQRVARRSVYIWQLLLTTLREIFDENAYERFLRRIQVSRSVESYRAFLLERESGLARKPRCC